MRKSLTNRILWLCTYTIALSLNGCKEDEVTYKLGQHYGGGIIFYLDGSGKHGLIAALTDQAIAEWSPAYSTTGATATNIGSGANNTNIIVASLGIGNYAARVCDDLVIDQYDDWFLPSRDELVELYKRKDLLGNFIVDYYWSSSEFADDTAWGQFFIDGELDFSLAKSGNVLGVRAIRAF